MTEQKNQVNNTTKDTDNPEERRLLRERADLMGMKYSPNISNEKLRERIQARLNDQPHPDDESEEIQGTQADDLDGKPTNFDNVSLEDAVAKILTNMGRPRATGNRLTKKQAEQLEREKQWAEQLKLVRCRITNHNPSKQQLKGEIITVVNKFVGRVSKFIPFEGFEDGYHIPQILVTELQGRQYQQIKSTKKDRNGLVNLPEHKLVNEYTIEILEPLSQKEIDGIARRQTAVSEA